jgi:hypothetical protein
MGEIFVLFGTKLRAAIASWKETLPKALNRNIVVYLPFIQVSIGINLIMFKSQYAFNTEDAPSKEEEILAGRPT